MGISQGSLIASETERPMLSRIFQCLHSQRSLDLCASVHPSSLRLIVPSLNARTKALALDVLFHQVGYVGVFSWDSFPSRHLVLI